MKTPIVTSIISISMLSLSISISILSFPLLASAGTWRDDFEDGDLKGWEVFNFERGAEKWSVTKGEAVGEIFQIGFMSLLLTGQDGWKDYSVQCRVRFVKTREQVKQDSSVGFTLHDQGDSDNRYLFFIGLDQTGSIIKVFQGAWQIISFPLEVKEDAWYSLKASVGENKLVFTVDNLEISARDPNMIPSGKAGLVVSNAVAHFDDVEISGETIPNGGPALPKAVEAKGKLSTTWGNLKSDRSSVVGARFIVPSK